VDCIQVENASGTATGWAAWTPTQADNARQRYAMRQQRLAQHSAEPPAPEPDADTLPAQSPVHAVVNSQASTAHAARQAAIAAATARARQRRNPPSH
jgi:electron transport complex protein RnfB